MSEHTARVSPTPEDNGPVLVLLGTEHIVKVQRKAVQVADVERAKVVVESVVQEGVVNGEVEGRRLGGAGNRLGALSSALRPLPRGLQRLRVGEKCVGRGRMDVSGEVEAVCDACQKREGGIYTKIQWILGMKWRDGSLGADGAETHVDGLRAARLAAEHRVTMRHGSGWHHCVWTWGEVEAVDDEDQEDVPGMYSTTCPRLWEADLEEGAIGSLAVLASGWAWLSLTTRARSARTGEEVSCR